LFGRPVEINVLLEPVKGDFHEKLFCRKNSAAFSSWVASI
jgi:hypothetical protein